MMSAIQLSNIQPNRILVITLRFLGDTLLATPLISSLKQAYPDAKIDVLTFKANAAMLENNPDINQLITLSVKPKALDFLKLLGRLFKRYDLAISTQAGDRPTLIAATAGKISMGFVPEESAKAWWKKQLLSDWLVFKKDHSHAVLENLRFCERLAIRPHYKLTPPKPSGQFQLPEGLSTPYAVLHIMPQWKYKQWHINGWLKIIDYLSDKGFQIVITGSSQKSEQESLNQLLREIKFSIINLSGQLSIPQLTELITNAELFIGPDTGITHLAASTGTLTLALFGPTDPKKWGPWPYGYSQENLPFASIGTQLVNNVCIIQGQTQKNCMPCQLEGCDFNKNSHSSCLDQLSANSVINIINKVVRRLN